MSRYTERAFSQPLETVEAWKANGCEPKPAWAEGCDSQDGWLVKHWLGIYGYSDDEFRRLYEPDAEYTQLANLISDDEFKFYSGFEVMDAVNE